MFPTSLALPLWSWAFLMTAFFLFLAVLRPKSSLAMDHMDPVQHPYLTAIIGYLLPLLV